MWQATARSPPLQEGSTPGSQDQGGSKSCHHCVQGPRGFELVEHWLSELDLPSEVGSSGSQPRLPPSSGLADPGCQTENERGTSGKGLPTCTLPIQVGSCATRWALPGASWVCLHSQVWLALTARPLAERATPGGDCMPRQALSKTWRPTPPLDWCKFRCVLGLWMR